MLGRQGAGKGTQAIRLAQHFVVPHISTGDMLRAAVAAGTEFGLRAKEVMDAGGLVSDEIMVGVVDERLNESDTTSRGYILDGFPRTVPQGESLEAITAERPLDVVVNLEVPESVVVERITKRRVCRTCGHIYSVDAPPKEGWICDVDGGEVVQRADDTVDAVRKRLDLYAAETLPLVPFYAERGLLVEVDGLGSTDEVFARLLDAVSARTR
ncbi:MAG: adenylate kinase [Acidimicrobiales bacterium]